MKITALIFSLVITVFGLKLNLTPNIPAMLAAVVIVMVIDFVTGVIKARSKKMPVTSKDARNGTIKKATQYFTAIILSLGILLLVKLLVKDVNDNVYWIPVFTCMFTIYVEIMSILENLNEVDNKSMMARFLFRPLLMIMKFGLEKNPIIKAKNEILNSNKNEQQS